MLTRLFDYLKMSGITTLVTDLSHAGENLERTDEEISSLIDTWILLRDIEIGGERNRALFVLKSRGMSHSNQVREYILSSGGISLVDVYTGPEGVLTGSARVAQQARESAGAAVYERDMARKVRDHERRRRALEARIEELRSELESETDELRFISEGEEKRRATEAAGKTEMARLRKADPDARPKR